MILKSIISAHRIGLYYFFYRYDLLESANFPFLSIENGIAATEATVGLLLYLFRTPTSPPTWLYLWSSASWTFFFSTFIVTAPVFARSRWMRRLYQLILGKWGNNWMGSEEMVAGCGSHGKFIMFAIMVMVFHGHFCYFVG